MADIVAIIAAVTALCAVVLGPLVSMWAADKQARVAVRSANRQAWINTLRDCLAEFVSLVTIISLSEGSDLRTKIEREFFLEAKIKLLLNPNETDHRALVELIDAVRTASGATMEKYDQSKEAVLRELVRRLGVLSQTILKREWERVKNAE
jgi:hypothetical protein